MNRYKVKAGIHVQDGKIYKTGQVVRSERPLDKLFREKFQDLGPVEAESTGKKKSEKTNE